MQVGLCYLPTTMLDLGPLPPTFFALLAVTLVVYATFLLAVKHAYLALFDTWL